MDNPSRGVEVVFVDNVRDDRRKRYREFIRFAYAHAYGKRVLVVGVNAQHLFTVPRQSDSEARGRETFSAAPFSVRDY